MTGGGNGTGGNGSHAFECRNIPIFYGAVDEDVLEFLGTFERIATADGWSLDQMSVILPAFLRGKAAEDWEALEVGVKTDYKQLRTSLVEKLAPTEVTSQYSLQLRGCKQGQNESVVQFARNIQKLVRKAYPDVESNTRERIAKDHFLNGLNSDLKRLTMTSSPANFDAAVARACEQECFAKIERVEEHWGKVSAAKLEETGNDVLGRRMEKLENAVLQILDQNGQTLNFLKNQSQADKRDAALNGFRGQRERESNGYTRSENRQNNPPRFNQNNRTRFSSNALPICNFCGKRGHLKFACRDRLRVFTSGQKTSQFMPNPTPRRVNFNSESNRELSLRQNAYGVRRRENWPSSKNAYNFQSTSAGQSQQTSGAIDSTALQNEIEILRAQNSRLTERILATETAPGKNQFLGPSRDRFIGIDSSLQRSNAVPPASDITRPKYINMISHCHSTSSLNGDKENVPNMADQLSESGRSENNISWMTREGYADRLRELAFMPAPSHAMEPRGDVVGYPALFQENAIGTEPAPFLSHYLRWPQLKIPQQMKRDLEHPEGIDAAMTVKFQTLCGWQDMLIDSIEPNFIFFATPVGNCDYFSTLTNLSEQWRSSAVQRVYSRVGQFCIVRQSTLMCRAQIVELHNNTIAVELLDFGGIYWVKPNEVFGLQDWEPYREIPRMSVKCSLVGTMMSQAHFCELLSKHFSEPIAVKVLFNHNNVHHVYLPTRRTGKQHWSLRPATVNSLRCLECQGLDVLSTPYTYSLKSYDAPELNVSYCMGCNSWQRARLLVDELNLDQSTETIRELGTSDSALLSTVHKNSHSTPCNAGLFENCHETYNSGSGPQVLAAVQLGVFPFIGKDNPFSNFYPAEVEIDGMVFKCNEQYYCYQKCLFANDRKAAAEILNIKCPADMKVKAKIAVHNSKVTADWTTSNQRVSLLRKANYAKFTQHGQLGDLLLETGEQILAEASLDKFWGCGLRSTSPNIYNTSSWTGRNEMGKILMELREELRAAFNILVLLSEVAAVSAENHPMPIVIGNLENECPIELLVDSGCNISVIALRVFRRINKFESWKVPELPLRGQARSVTGQSLTLIDLITLELELGENLFKHSFYVVETLPYDGILGTDFMKKFGVTLDLGRGVLCIENHNLSLWPQIYSGAALMLTKENTVIPPYSEIICSGIATKELNSSAVLMEGIDEVFEEHGVLAARSLLASLSRESPLRLVNLSSEAVLFPKHFQVGTLEEVQGVVSDFQEPDIKCEIDLSAAGLAEEQKQQLFHLCSQFADIFSRTEFYLGNTLVTTHTINTGDNLPVKQRAYRIPEASKADVHRQLREMEQHGIIRPSACPWCSPIVVVKKKNGQNRICVDYRKLNLLTKSDVFPLPRIDAILDKVGKSTIFSSLDLASGYHQIEVAETDKEKTAFSPGDDLYEYNVMPFGLKSAPATFQRAMQFVLAGVKSCYMYIDDILVASKGFDQHLEDLSSVFERLRKANLKLKPKKCKFAQEKVCFLGHQISEAGIEPDREKVRAIRSFPVPTRVRELKSFLGLCSYYRKFVPNFAYVAQELNSLLKKNTPFVWTPGCESAFGTLKERLCNYPVLVYPDYKLPFILITDASDYGLGAILSQLIDGHEKPNAYASRTLNQAERNYSVTEREALAAVWAITYFRHYLYGRKFTIITDHQALKWLMTIKNPAGRLARWSLLLQEFDFEVMYRPGKRNCADGLSRVPVEDESRMEISDRFEEHVLCAISYFLNPEVLTEPQEAGKRLPVQAFAEPQHTLLDNWNNEEITWEELQITEVLEDMHEENKRYEEAKLKIACSMEAEKSEETEVLSSRLPEAVPIASEATTNGWQRLKEEQRKDASLLPIIAYLEGEEEDYAFPERAKHSWNSDFVMVDEVLHHIWREESQARRPEYHLQIVIPVTMQNEILEAMHDDVLSGHLGTVRTFRKLRQRYFFFKMFEKVYQWCKSCVSCQTRKPPAKYVVRPLQPLVVANVFDVCVVDCLGPLPATETGLKYVVLFVDHFSKWPEAFATANIKANTVAKLFVEEIVCRHAVPRCLLSDRGPCFISALVQAVCELMNTRKLDSTAYRPQTQGLVERMNRTLLSMISHYVSAHHKDWDECLPYILFAYRTSVHETTGVEPFVIVYGRPAKLPVDLALRQRSMGNTDVLDYLSKITKKLAETRQLVLRHTAKNQRHYKAVHDANIGGDEFCIGDKVWLNNPTVPKNKSKKLIHRWLGPYTVLEVQPDSNLRIKLCSNLGNDFVVHQARCKLCYEAPEEEDYGPISEENAVDFLTEVQEEAVSKAAGAVAEDTNTTLPETMGMGTAPQHLEVDPRQDHDDVISDGEQGPVHQTRPTLPPTSAWYRRTRSSAVNVIQLLLTLLACICLACGELIKPSIVSNFSLTANPRIRFNPRYGVLFRAGAKLDNAQDFLTHYFVIPVKLDIQAPASDFSCDLNVNVPSAGLDLTAYLVCESLHRLNDSMWNTYNKVSEKLQDLRTDMLKLNHNISTTHPKSKRVKRGLLGGLVCLIESIFGGCNHDPIDVESLKRILKRVSLRTGYLSHEISNVNGRLMTLSKLTTTGFKNTAQKFNVVTDSLDEISRFQKTLAHNLNETRFRQRIGMRLTHYLAMFGSQSSKWNVLMTNWYEQLDSAYRMLESVMFLETGKLSPVLVPPHILSKIIIGLSKKLKASKTEFMYPVESIDRYYQIPCVTAVFLSGHSFIIKAELSVAHEDMLFQLWHVKHAQTKMPNSEAYIHIENSYDVLAVNRASSQYIITKADELANCHGLGRSVTRCAHIFSVLPAKRVSCLVALFNLHPHTVIEENCNVVLKTVPDISQNFELSAGQWFIAVPRNDWMLFCEEKLPIKIESCTHCVVNIPCGCGLSMKEETLPVRYHSCSRHDFETAHAFNPFVVLTPPPIVDLFNATQLFKKPWTVPRIPKLDSLIASLKHNLNSDRSLCLNFTKFTETVQSNDSNFVAVDQYLSRYVSRAVAQLHRTESYSWLYMIGLLVGEITLALFTAMLFVWSCVGGSLRNSTPIPTLLPLPNSQPNVQETCKNVHVPRKIYNPGHDLPPAKRNDSPGSSPPPHKRPKYSTEKGVGSTQHGRKNVYAARLKMLETTV